MTDPLARAQTPPPDSDAPSEDGRDPDVVRTPGTVSGQLSLDLEDPIPFSLTARARRALSPPPGPPLRAVGAAGDAPTDGSDRLSTPMGGRAVDGAVDAVDDVTDTRPARARALRRGGAAIADIAAALDADDLEVVAWTADISAPPAGRARLRAVPPRSSTPHRQARSTAVSPPPDEFDDVRRSAREGVAQRLDAPGFAAGLGIVSAVGRIDGHAVTLTLDDLDVGRLAMAWVREQLGVDDGRVRIVVRFLPDVAGDLAAHAWADALGVAPERVTASRWRGPGAPSGGSQALVRVADPRAAARVAGWRDGLVGAVPTSA